MTVNENGVSAERKMNRSKPNHHILDTSSGSSSSSSSVVVPQKTSVVMEQQSVWVKVGKTEHQAWLLETLTGEDDNNEVLIRWGTTGHKDYVDVESVRIDCGGRRSRRGATRFNPAETKKVDKKKPKRKRPTRSSRVSSKRNKMEDPLLLETFSKQSAETKKSNVVAEASSDNKKKKKEVVRESSCHGDRRDDGGSEGSRTRDSNHCQSRGEEEKPTTIKHPQPAAKQLEQRRFPPNLIDLKRKKMQARKAGELQSKTDDSDDDSSDDGDSFTSIGRCSDASHSGQAIPNTTSRLRGKEKPDGFEFTNRPLVLNKITPPSPDEHHSDTCKLEKEESSESCFGEVTNRRLVLNKITPPSDDSVSSSTTSDEDSLPTLNSDRRNCLSKNVDNRDIIDIDSSDDDALVGKYKIARKRTGVPGERILEKPSKEEPETPAQVVSAWEALVMASFMRSGGV